MVKLKYLKLTDDLKARIALAVEARDEFPVGLFGWRPADAIVTELAEEILKEVEHQEAEYIARLGRLPARAAFPLAVVEVSLRPKRRRRA